VGPESGFLACGDADIGRMSEPEDIVRAAEEILCPVRDLEGLNVLVTAGPTVERIDPVRFIGNHSSGLMGIEIARAFADQGAEVTLVLGPSNISVNKKNVNVMPVTSAKEMYDAVMALFPKTDIAVLSAAVADFRPEMVADQKIKKNPDNDTFTIKLVKTEDILKSVGNVRNDNQTVVGFALETENGLENAKKKLHTKNIDLIVLNEMNESGVGFKTKTNKVSIITKDDKVTTYDLKPKNEVALDILNAIYQYIN
jgi:phosphopantothenoylcysteine decarboxylase/phosphopantothenate--cysteine ligase